VNWFVACTQIVACIVLIVLLLDGAPPSADDESDSGAGR
jgi:hypothetical protein